MITSHVETLWHEMNVTLKRFIVRRVPDESTADDILQEVFVRIHTRAASLKDTAKLESWIYRITRNVVVDYYRTRKDESEIPETLPATETSDEDDLASQLAPCLRAMVDDLPAKYRDALRLTEYEGLTQHDLAKRLGISLSGAKSRVQRAREQLKNLLLQCCHLEFDHLGRIIDYHPHCNCCTSSQEPGSCLSNYATETNDIPE